MGSTAHPLAASASQTLTSDCRANIRRVLLYSHDSWGLGHLRRSLAIAGAITQSLPGTDCLIVTGSPCATQFQPPPGCDLVKLPAVSKAKDGQYVPRQLSGSLADTISLRARLLLETFRAFAPHVLIVDHQLVGLHGEALAVLREARATGVRTIYGLRDVLDAPDEVARLWDSSVCRWALREAYDCVCVYGQRQVYDPTEHYALLRSYAGRLEFTGYIVPPNPPSHRRPVPLPRGQVLVTVGGGQDGTQRIEAYLAALALSPCEWDSHIITGPLMDARTARRLKRIATNMIPSGSVVVHRFHADLPKLLGEADAVVAMAGYNTCCEVLQSGCPAVLLPRSFPRREQLIRSQCLADLGLVTTLDSLDPLALRTAVEGALFQRAGAQGQRPALDGLSRVCELVRELSSASQSGYSAATAH